MNNLINDSWNNLMIVADCEDWILPKYSKSSYSGGNPSNEYPRMPKAYIKIYNQIMNSDIPKTYEEESGDKFEEISDLIFGQETSVSKSPVIIELNNLLNKYCYEC